MIRRKFRSLITLLSLTSCLAVLYNFSATTVSHATVVSEQAPASENVSRPDISITLAIGGDVNLGRRQNWVSAQNGPGHALGQLDILRNSDLAFVNLESVVAATGTLGINKNEGGPYYYRGRPEMLAVLEKAGIDFVGLANNHSLDYGAEALAEELSYFKQMKLFHAGAGRNRDEACAPVLVQVRGLRLAIFAIDLTLPPFAATAERAGTCYFDTDDREGIRKFFSRRIPNAKQKAHVVLVTPHWGKNFSREPSDDIRRIAHDLIDFGADGIFASSAHIIKGIEVYKGKPVLYDTGNLLFDETRDRKRPAALFQLIIDPTGIRRVEIHPIRPKFGYTELAARSHTEKTLSYIQEKSRKLGSIIRRKGATGVLDLPPHQTKNSISVLSDDLPGPGPVTSAPAPLTAPPAECHVDEIPGDARITPVKFGQFELLGLRLSPEFFDKRQLAYVETFWRTDKKPEKDFWIYTRLQGQKDSSKKWYGDHEPCDWNWPTSRWTAGTIYRDRYAVRPPNPLPADSYVPVIGILDRESKTRWLKEFSRHPIELRSTP